MPGRISVSSDGKYTFKLTFDKSCTLIDLDIWIRQPILSPTITVWELIKSVADKEGAHSDPEYNETLVRAKLVRYVRDESHIPIIIGIGEYVLWQLNESGAIDA
jgi:hypothetical protein